MPAARAPLDGLVQGQHERLQKRHEAGESGEGTVSVGMSYEPKGILNTIVEYHRDSTRVLVLFAQFSKWLFEDSAAIETAELVVNHRKRKRAQQEAI